MSAVFPVQFVTANVHLEAFQAKWSIDINPCEGSEKSILIHL